MNIQKILNEIKGTEPEVFERLTERRQILKDMGAKALALGLPVAVASLLPLGSKAQTGAGSSTATTAAISTLNYLLELEFIQFNYFHIGNNTGDLVPSADQPGLLTIETQDAAHITFLRNLINTLGGTPFTPAHYTYNALTGNPYSPYSYDFTAGGTYQIYSASAGDYTNFLELGQVIKDLMVRAYQAQVANLLSNTGSSLGGVMQVMGAEGRHAAHLRLMRRFMAAPEYPKPWITNNIPPAQNFSAFYTGEDNTIQYGGINITTLAGVNGAEITETAATEAFDEPMSQTSVLSLLAPFILS